MSIVRGMPQRHALGVDFGTSNTVAVARWPDGRARPILIDGSPLLPSAVYAEPDGQLIVGRDAVHSARLDPARYEPNPKRRVDDGLVLLGDEEFPAMKLFAAVLGRVAEEWRRAAGPVPTDVTLTCPATWGATRRTLLADAAAEAGLTGARLVAEPVAAATYFAEVLGRDVPIGSVVVVHDFGAGTFDASVVARTAEGFEVMAVDGRDDIGGLDVDAAIVAHLRDDSPEWGRLAEPETVTDRRAQRQLWDDVRIAKERLSRTQSADLVVPLLNREIHLTRDELEQLARPVLEQTVQVTGRLLRWADLPPGRLAGVFLVGGASRIPLVATLLHRELGEAPVVIEQPEMVVAEGSILADAALLASGAAAPGPTSEMRLVFDRRAEAETVVTVRPANDPANDRAANDRAANDRVRAREKSDGTPAAPGGPSGPLPAAGRDGAAAAAASGPGVPPPAVDPWPHAPRSWVPDPAATVADDSPWRIEPGPPQNRATATAPSRPAPAAPSRSAAPRRSAAAVPTSPARPITPSYPASPATPPGGYRPEADRPRRPVRRRPGRFLRFVQIVFSVVLLIAAPIAALVFAYSFGTGESLPDAVDSLIDELRRLVRSRIA